MLPITRRTFLSTSSMTVASAIVGTNRSGPRALCSIPVRSRQPIAAFLPALVDPQALRVLALAGVDAARQAGADYADIRVADVRWFRMRQEPIAVPVSEIDFEISFGVRACVRGVWSTAFGVDPTVDAVVGAARRAVGIARGIVMVAAVSTGELAASAVARGEWNTPIQIDPFLESPDAHAEVIGAYKEMAERVPGASLGIDQVTWTGETRVFASTDDALVTQRLVRAEPIIYVYGSSLRTDENTIVPVPGFAPCSAGFEILTGAALQERIKASAEEAVQLAGYAEANADIGRYEAVMDGVAAGITLGATLIPALEIDRVVSNETGGSGTSFLMPMDAILGQPLLAPQLTVTTDRAIPHYGAVRWDDEGVVPEAFSLIEHGRIIDYFTTRATAPLLAAWYARQKKPPVSHGSAVAWAPTAAPIGCASQVTMAPDISGPTLDSLIKHLPNGILVRGVRDALEHNGVHADRQFTSGWFRPGMLFEVRRGQITRRLSNAAVQFNTKQLWNSIATVGNEGTVEGSLSRGARSEISTGAIVPITAPAMQLRQLDVISIDRYR